MKLVLYAVAVSAFAAKVRTALEFKGLPFEEREPPGGYGSEAYRALVPAGSVPGLSVDGVGLHGSNAILEFLEEVAPAPALLPGGALDRARVRGLLDVHDNRVEAAVRALFPLVKRDWRAEPAAVEAACLGVEAALDRLRALAPDAPWRAGAAPSWVDLSFPCTFQMADMLGAEMRRPLPLPPDLAAWAAACAEIPAVARSLALHRAAMEAWMAGFRRDPEAGGGG